MRKAILTVVAICYAISLAACHTMAGAGEDIQEAGHKLQKSAERHE